MTSRNHQLKHKMDANDRKDAECKKGIAFDVFFRYNVL